ncbi:MAG: hypothetical protein IJ327_00295 [Lachnospiraceae bacterium]|nr:hypothetical protein [Lachnospiraceae bacterium]
MKEKVKKYIGIYGRYVLAGFTVFCWWSIFFPQMVMNENCYRVLEKDGRPVTEESLQAEEPDWMDLPAYWEILEAEEDEVVLTGKLWEYFKDKGWIKE